MKKRPVFNWADPDRKFMAWDLEPNEIFSEEYAYYKLDVSNFDFDKIDARKKLFDSDHIRKFLDSHKINVGVDEFINLMNLQSYMYMMWPEHAKNRPFREDVFKISHCNKNNPMLLSEAFRKKIAGCVECSLLAQMYLQHCGMESKVCCGNTFFEKNPKIELGGDAHAYLVVHMGGREYIYDPSNPMLDSRGRPNIPRIMSFLSVPFRDRRAFNDLLRASVADGGGFAYVEASDIYGVGSCWLYGFESNDEENNISRRRTPAGIKRQAVNQEQPQPVNQPGVRDM